MLKITSRTEIAAVATIVLEGQVAGRWVDELRVAFAETRQRRGDAAVMLDLKDVTFIDAAGLAFFEEVGSAVTVSNCSLFAAEQLKGVIARHQAVRS